MKRLFALLLIVAGTAHADPAAVSGAFSDGVNFGRAKNATTKSGITSGAAQANVPHATSTSPESSYFGAPGLGTPAAARINACASVTPNSGLYDDQACNAVNFSQTNPAARGQFTLHPTDPLFVNTKTILNDPAAIAGNIAGTYSGCTTQTVKTPDVFQTQVCNEYHTLQQNTCNKTLTVSVVDNGLNCSYGAYLTANPRIMLIRPFVFVGAICADDIRFMWIYGYSECNGSNAAIPVPTVVPSADYQRLIVNLGCGGQYYLVGSCPGGSCSYVVGIPNGNFVCDQYCEEGCCAGHVEDYPLASFTYQRPTHTFTITDAWDNQCAALEARLP